MDSVFANPNAGRASRGLSRQVLIPLVAGGLALLVVVAAAATLIAREAAVRQLDARADSYRALSEASLQRGDRLGSGAVARRRAHVQLRDPRPPRRPTRSGDPVRRGHRAGDLAGARAFARPRRLA